MITAYIIVTFAKLNYVMKIGIVNTVGKRTTGYAFSLNRRECIFAQSISIYIIKAQLVTLQYILTSGTI